MEQEENLRICQNCSQQFPAFKIDLHEAYCKRNIRRCKLCSKMVDINDQETHYNQFHAQKPCSFCNMLFIPTQLQEHAGSCDQRPTECKYCQNVFPFSDIIRHEEGCGSRTKLCERCRKYIKIREQKEHISKCQGELRRNQSQELRQLNQLYLARGRMKSNDNSKKEGLNPYSPRLVPKRTQQIVKIEREPISQLVDPVPISVRLAMVRDKSKRRHK